MLGSCDVVLELDSMFAPLPSALPPASCASVVSTLVVDVPPPSCASVVSTLVVEVLGSCDVVLELEPTATSTPSVSSLPPEPSLKVVSTLVVEVLGAADVLELDPLVLKSKSTVV